MATLIYFNQNFKLQSLEFSGASVQIQDYSFIAGIVQDGKRVAPGYFENLSDLEIYAINGQFFDLNQLEKTGFQPPREVVLMNLSSIYTSGSGSAALALQTSQFNQLKSPSIGSRNSNQLLFSVNSAKGFRSRVIVSLRPTDTYFDLDSNDSSLNQNFPVFHSIDQPIPFENLTRKKYMEYWYAPWGSSSSAYLNGFGTDKLNGVSCFSIFDVFFAVVRKHGSGADLSGFVVVIDLHAGTVHSYQESLVGDNTGYLPVVGGYAQKGARTGLIYTTDLTTAKNFVTTEKTRLGV